MLALCVAIGAAVLVLAACGEQPSAPSGTPSITGIVKTADAGSEGSAVGSFLVVQGSGEYDTAQVSVTADTVWYRTNGRVIEPVKAPTADALRGKRVRVRFTGPVAESYPVQATAAWVIVTE